MDEGDERGADEGSGGGDVSGAADEDPDDAYVHDPGGAEPVPPAEREFGRQGWLLVAAIVVAFLVIPGVIYLNVVGVLAFPFRVAFLALPMLPAVALAVIAVWATATE
jgi:hypothetical protein